MDPESSNPPGEPQDSAPDVDSLTEAMTEIPITPNLDSEGLSSVVGDVDTAEQQQQPPPLESPPSTSDLIEISLSGREQSNTATTSNVAGPLPSGPPTMQAMPSATTDESDTKPPNPFEIEVPSKAAAAAVNREVMAAAVQPPSPPKQAVPSGEQATAGVVIVGTQAELRTKASNLKDLVQEQYHITKQLMQEKFKKDKTGLITPDDDIDRHLLTLTRIEDDFARLQKTMKAYQTNIEELAKSQEAMSQYLTQQGNKSPVGTVMVNLGAAQTALASSMKKTVTPAVAQLLSQLHTYSAYVLKDTNESKKKLAKLRVKYDAERKWLSELEAVKEKKPEKYAQVRTKFETSEKEYGDLRKDVMTKILMVNDNRIQMMNKALAEYHRAITEHMVEGSDVLGSAVGSQKAVVGDDSSSKLVLD